MKAKTCLAPFALLSLVFVTACASSGAASSSTKDSSSSSSPTSSKAILTSSETSTLTSSVISSSISGATFTKKATDVYVQSLTPTSGANLYFTASSPDIPFLDVQEFNDFLVQQGLDMTFTLPSSSSVGTFARGKATATLDFAKGIFTMNDFQHFFALGHKISFLDPMMLTRPDSSGVNHYLKRADSGNALIDGASWSVDLSAYQIPVYAETGKVFMPLTTYSDLFLNPVGWVLAYNTKAIFFGSDIGSYASLYYTDDVKGTRSESLAQFTYHEFCMAMDHSYGLQAAHGITNFDDFITRSGFKTDMLSSDAAVSSAAYSRFIFGRLDDSHSGVTSSSYLCGNVEVVKKDYYGPSMKERAKQRALYTAARTAVYAKNIVPYEVVGNDTAIITFDQFLTAKGDYYATKPTETDASKDTVALVNYAAAQIASDSAIKNVVLDLSLNGGGSVDAGAYLLSWMLGGFTMHMMDPIDGARASITYCGDTNLDGVFDENDYLSGKHIYCLTSMTSFSCGNLVPCACKASGAVTLLGRTSGGGACVVGHSCLADGTFFQFSSQEMICTRKNGSYYSVDQGAEPDVVISDPASFYDRTALRAKILSL